MRQLTLTTTQLEEAIKAWSIGGSLGLGLFRAKLKCDYNELLSVVLATLRRRGLPTGLDEDQEAQPEPRKGEYLIPPGARSGTCRSCKAPVIWTITPKGAHMPLSEATIQERDGQRYALAHFSDCPHGKGWSKK